MRFRRLAAPALLAAGATALAAGTAHAAPAPATPPPVAIQGVEQGIGYTAGPSADGSALVTTLESGQFRIAANAVLLTDATGRTVSALPTTVHINGAPVGLSPSLADNGRTLLLTPVNAPAVGERLADFVDENATLARKQHNAVVGALIGAGIGAVLGFFLGGVGALITVPIGAGIGALIGFSTP
ncbi:MAG TPA: hypothetical protein VK083_00220 [Nocardia sp.]|uniref:hypothetical protein n=1 Tax=Nocardia TaxID=1817 RepID=UPI002455F326|nr:MULTISPECIES: hypothetical protein [Nocardia]HLS75202.1 hypothetical protein [Nocardia sp.]